MDDAGIPLSLPALVSCRGVFGAMPGCRTVGSVRDFFSRAWSTLFVALLDFPYLNFVFRLLEPWLWS